MRAILVRILCAVVVMLLLTMSGGCNSSSSSSGGSSDGSPSGAYLGTLSYYNAILPPSAPVKVFGAVGKDGTGYFLPESKASADLMVFQGLMGTGAVTSPEYDVPTEGLSVPGGPQDWHFTVTATNPSGIELTGSFMGVDTGTNADLTAAPTLSVHSGAYQGTDVNRLTSVTATLDANDKLSGNDGLGCHISGTLTEEGDTGLYDVSLEITGSSSCHGALTGVAFFDATDLTGQFSGAAGTYLYLLGANGDFSHGFAMALKLE